MVEEARERRRRGVVVALLLSSTAMVVSGVARAEDAAATPPAGGIDEHVANLGSLDLSERVAAVRALGASGSSQAVAPLARVLREDPSAEVRGWSVRALAEIGTPEARTALAMAAQHDSDQRVRQLAAQVSGHAQATPFEATAPTPSPVVESPVVQVGPGPMRGPLQQRRRHPGLALIIAGWSAFGASYLISMIAGGATLAEGAETTWTLFIPTIGPVIQAGFLFDDYDELMAPLAVLLFLDALIQIAGVSMGTVGLVRRHRARQAESGGPAEPEAEVEPAASSRSWGLAVLPSTGGLAVSGWF